MFRKFIRELGFMLITGSTMFTPLIASADGDSAIGAVAGFPIGALITGVILVSMSSNKSKATKAEKYVKGDLELNLREDIFVRQDVSRKKLDK